MAVRPEGPERLGVTMGRSSSDARRGATQHEGLVRLGCLEKRRIVTLKLIAVIKASERASAHERLVVGDVRPQVAVGERCGTFEGLRAHGSGCIVKSGLDYLRLLLGSASLTSERDDRLKGDGADVINGGRRVYPHAGEQRVSVRAHAIFRRRDRHEVVALDQPFEKL